GLAVVDVGDDGDVAERHEVRVWIFGEEGLPGRARGRRACRRGKASPPGWKSPHPYGRTPVTCAVQPRWGAPDGAQGLDFSGVSQVTVMKTQVFCIKPLRRCAPHRTLDL